MEYTFGDPGRELLVITTITNWNEPPRIRHEIAHQMSRFYNVLYVQIYNQKNYIRKSMKVSESLVVEKSGFSFPGILRLMIWSPMFMRAYNSILSMLIGRLVRRFGYRRAILCNFQFNFPQVYDSTMFFKTVYFCNEHFVDQNLVDSVRVKNIKRMVQRQVLQKSDLVFTVSAPLKTLMEEEGAKNTHVILSGHGFNTALSYSLTTQTKPRNIFRACYLGFLSEFIAIDWLEALCQEENVQLTLIGPIVNLGLISKMRSNKYFRHIECLVGDSLHRELMTNDVCLMPYSSPVDNEVTSAPAKLFQYLAAGRPIVSSKMPNLIPMPVGFVYQADGANEFVLAVKQALLEDNEFLIKKRIEFSADNSWDARGRFMYDRIQKIAAVH